MRVWVRSSRANERRAGLDFRSGHHAARCDTALWTYEQDSFLPHGSARDGNAEAQPVWLTVEDENPNGATVLVLTDGTDSPQLDRYARCVLLFDGTDEAALAAARRRWQAYKTAGHKLTYLQQTEYGGWEQRAEAG